MKKSIDLHKFLRVHWFVLCGMFQSILRKNFRVDVTKIEDSDKKIFYNAAIDSVSWKKADTRLTCPFFRFLERHSLVLLGCSYFCCYNVYQCARRGDFLLHFKSLDFGACTHTWIHLQYIRSQKCRQISNGFLFTWPNYFHIVIFALACKYYWLVLFRYVIYQLFVVISVSHIWSRNKFVGFSFISAVVWCVYPNGNKTVSLIDV